MQTATTLAAVYYTQQLGLISYDLTRISYCVPDNITNYNYTTTLAPDFVPTLMFYNDTYDISGYIGYLPSQKAIYVVFRGIFSNENRKVART